MALGTNTAPPKKTGAGSPVPVFWLVVRSLRYARAVPIVLGAIAALALLACPAAAPELHPATVSQTGGVELSLSIGRVAGEGSAIVLVDGLPTHSTVVEAPGLLRVRLPPLPRGGRVDIEVEFADGTSIEIPSGLEVRSPGLEVRARD